MWVVDRDAEGADVSEFVEWASEWLPGGVEPLKTSRIVAGGGGLERCSKCPVEVAALKANLGTLRAGKPLEPARNINSIDEWLDGIAEPIWREEANERVPRRLPLEITCNIDWRNEWLDSVNDTARRECSSGLCVARWEPGQTGSDCCPPDRPNKRCILILATSHISLP